MLFVAGSFAAAGGQTLAEMRGGEKMTTDRLIAILSLVIASISLGITLGR